MLTQPERLRMESAKQHKLSQTLKKRISKKQEEFDKARADETRRIKQAYNAVANTVNGRIVFRDIMAMCGYEDYKIVGDKNTALVDTVSSLHNAALEKLYINIRRRIRRSLLVKIEFPNLDQEED